MCGTIRKMIVFIQKGKQQLTLIHLIFHSSDTTFLHTNLSYNILRFVVLTFSNSFTNDSYFGHSHHWPLIGIIYKGSAMTFFTGKTQMSDVPCRKMLSDDPSFCSRQSNSITTTKTALSLRKRFRIWPS